MQILNTYLNQGVPILDALADNFNTTTCEIVKMASSGKISFADFSKALDDLTAAGGQYFGGMELASESLAAMQEGLTEATNTLAASFGDMLMPVAIAVIQALTDITNAINESPLLKGLLIGAIVALTGYLAAMAVKAGIAFAAQMALNLSIGALNPVVLATTIAVAGLAAGYTAVAAQNQKATRETENAALQQLKLRDAVNSTADAIRTFHNALNNMSDSNLSMNIESAIRQIGILEKSIVELTTVSIENFNRGNITRGEYFAELVAVETRNLERMRLDLETALNIQVERRTNWIDSMFDNTQSAKIQKINEQLDIANRYLAGSDLSETDRQRLQEIVRGLNTELARLTNRGQDINRMATDWKKAWADIFGQFQADQNNDLFFSIELERRKKLEDAWNNYVRSGNRETLDQVNEYYNAQRREVIRQLDEEERRINRELSQSKIGNIEHELRVAIEAINTLEAQRIIAAGNSEEEIAAIRERFVQMRNDTEIKFEIEIDKAKLDEAKESIRGWQEVLSDNLLTILMDLETFNVRASVVLSNLITQFTELSATATLSGFEEFGRALGQGEDAAESMSRALALMSKQILQQLPMLFLQAGLQLIANGQWPLGLGFIAAAGSSAIISGYVDGASKHAQGGVFDEYGKTAKAYAAGGTFTNQIISTPTYFAHGGGFGLMGEAGPEAIMPLTRLPNGDLGVQTTGTNGGSKVIVNIINNTGAEVRQVESEGEDGSRQIDVMIGDLVNNHFSSGKADRVMGGRYGLRAMGV
jgi:hypothetical protein